MKLAIFVVFKASAIENTNVKARVKEKRNRFLNQNSNLRASLEHRAFMLCSYILDTANLIYKAHYPIVGSD